jgi:hypothetical protein
MSLKQTPPVRTAMIQHEEAPPFIELRKTDVLLGRGNGVATYPGNLAFRRIVWARRPHYEKSIRNEKRKVAALVVQEVQALDPPGRFVVAFKRGHVVVSATRALEKTCQALREKKISMPREPDVDKADQEVELLPSNRKIKKKQSLNETSLRGKSLLRMGKTIRRHMKAPLVKVTNSVNAHGAESIVVAEPSFRTQSGRLVKVPKLLPLPAQPTKKKKKRTTVDQSSVPNKKQKLYAEQVKSAVLGQKHHQPPKINLLAKNSASKYSNIDYAFKESLNAPSKIFYNDKVEKHGDEVFLFKTTKDTDTIDVHRDSDFSDAIFRSQIGVTRHPGECFPSPERAPKGITKVGLPAALKEEDALYFEHFRILNDEETIKEIDCDADESILSMMPPHLTAFFSGIFSEPGPVTLAGPSSLEHLKAHHYDVRTKCSFKGNRLDNSESPTTVSDAHRLDETRLEPTHSLFIDDIDEHHTSDDLKTSAVAAWKEWVENSDGHSC